MQKYVKLSEIDKYLNNGMSIMFGGFMCNGQALEIADYILQKNITDITIICNDAGLEDVGIGKLIKNSRVKKLIASHIGLNPEAGRLMSAGKMDVDLVPQGTLAERIRAAGAGLGGVLTPTGIATVVEDGKQIITIDGKLFLLEMPLRADLAVLHASVADDFGNLQHLGTTRNFNPLMALACDVVIAEAQAVVDAIDPNFVHTPGVLVDYVVKAGACND